MNRFASLLPAKLHTWLWKLTGWMLVEHYDDETGAHIRWEWIRDMRQ